MTIQNQYGKPVPTVKVSIGEETRTFNDVAEGAEVAVPLRSKGDPLRVEVKFADGTLKSFSGPAANDGDPAVLVIQPGGDIVPRKTGK